jgi:CRISPR system Cascade subunit CasD
MEQLVFQLQAPLSSWGEPAVGEYRGTADVPSQSALIGLLGAALGLEREDEAAHAALRDGYGWAVAQLDGGSLLRDYHTAQVPPRSALKGRPHATRRHELSVPKDDLGTILSTRDYRQNAVNLVALQPRSTTSAPYALAALADALRRPRFVLYLGRKTCAPAAPLWPQLIGADSAKAAFEQYRSRFDAARQGAAVKGSRAALLEALPPIAKVTFDDHVTSGLTADLTTRRKDRLIRRRGWQFGDRNEHIALLSHSSGAAASEA